MKSIIYIFCFVVCPCLASPICEITHQSSDKKINVVSGRSSGFQQGKVYITLSNGTRNYTTVAEKTGLWAISFPSLEKKSDIVCWQEGNGKQAKTFATHP